MPRFWDCLNDADKVQLKARWPMIRPPKDEGGGVSVDSKRESREEIARIMCQRPRPRGVKVGR